MCGLFIIFLVTFAYKSHIKYMKGDVVVSETPSDSAPTPTILVCVKQVNLLSRLECDEAPKHFLPATTINSPHYQEEFIVCRIFSVVAIFLGPFMVEVALRYYGSVLSVNSTIKGLKNMVTSEKILQTMNS